MRREFLTNQQSQMQWMHVLFDAHYHFYRAMHFSAKRGIEIACRLSVCLSVTLVDQGRITYVGNLGN